MSWFRPPVVKSDDPNRVVTIDTPHQYFDEVRKLQSALGVDPDGRIGPKTRAAVDTLAQAAARHKEVLDAIKTLSIQIADPAKLAVVNQGLVELGGRIDAIIKSDKKLTET